MTVAENLALASQRRGRTLRPAISRRRRAAFVGRLSDLGVDLTTRLDDPVSTLSGGERQALAVAMATLSRPDLLLLDEHTAALDPKNAERIVELTRAFVEESCLTTIMVTHNMDQAIELGNRLAMMHKGQFVHEVRDEAKRRARVCDLVDLFSRRHVADDELLLDPA
jgi:putative ABC transport system ATP-binding protein